MSEPVAGHPELRSAAAKGVVWLTLERWFDQGLSLAVFILLSRLLSPREFGVVATATVLVSFLRVIADGGVSRSIVRRRTLTDAYTNTAFWISLAVALLFTVVTIVLAPAIGSLYGIPGITNVTRVLSLIFLLTALDGTQSALVDRAMLFRVQAIRRLVATVVSAIVAVSLALLGAGVWALVGQVLSLELVTVAALWTLASWRPSRKVGREHVRELISFGIPYSGLRLMWFVGGNADNFLIALTLGATQLGYYVVAYRILVVVSELTLFTVNHVALPAFASLQDDPARQRSLFRVAVSVTSAFAIPCYVGLALISDTLIPLVFGAKWTPSVHAMQFLALAGAIRCLSVLVHNFCLAAGRVAAEFRWFAALTTVEVIAFAATVHFGITAVAAGLFVVEGVAFPLRVRTLTRWSNIQWRDYLDASSSPIAATVVMAGGVLGARFLVDSQSPVIVLAVCIATGGLVYASTLWLIGRSTIEAALEAFGWSRGGNGSPLL